MEQKKIIYIYDEKGFFLHEEYAYLNPVTQKDYLMPPDATDVKPPEEKGFVARWDGKKWTQEKDNRGVKYFDENGTEQEIKEIGEELPTNYSKDPRPTQYHILIDGMWVISKENAKNQLDDAIKTKVAEINQAKDVATESDIKYKGIFYQTDQTAQIRLLAVLGAKPPEMVWIASDNSEQLLTLADLNALYNAVVMRTGEIVVLAAKIKKQVETSQTIDEVNKITADFTSIVKKYNGE